MWSSRSAASAYAAALQRFVVAPNEQVRETPYIVHNVAATRDAFALDQRGRARAVGRCRADARRHRAERRHAQERAAVGSPAAARHVRQIQEIRTYYDFVSVDNDRYTINGEYRQIMLSARELDSASLPNRNWINERLTFTHGYGLTLGPVNQVTPEGLPVLFIKNLPPESTVDLPGDRAEHLLRRAVERPRVRADAHEGVPLSARRGQRVHRLQRRRAASASAGCCASCSSASGSDRSRRCSPTISPRRAGSCIYRRIRRARRADRAVPRLRSGSVSVHRRGSALLDSGRLHDEQPLSVRDACRRRQLHPQQHQGRHRRVPRHDDLLSDRPRGIRLRSTLDRAFPGLLRPLSAMPEGLRTRLRYPQTIFALQAAMFSTYHMNNPAVFYNKEDQWEVPAIGTGNKPQRMEPYYAIMRLPGERRVEYIQMLPFTPRQKDNLAAWMVAKSDGDQYGRLVVFKFPKQKVDLRATAGGGAHQPGSGDLAADHAVEPAGLRGDPGHPAGDSDRGVAHLHPAAVSARSGRSHPRAQARHRRLPEPDRDGGNARGGHRAHLRRQPACARRPRVEAGRRQPRRAVRSRPLPPPSPWRARRRRWPPRRAHTTSGPSRRSARATGRSTARRFASSGTCCDRWSVVRNSVDSAVGRRWGLRRIPGTNGHPRIARIPQIACRGSNAAGLHRATFIPQRRTGRVRRVGER